MPLPTQPQFELKKPPKIPITQQSQSPIKRLQNGMVETKWFKMSEQLTHLICQVLLTVQS